MEKPLYGSRQAPLRRFVKASEALRRLDFRQRRIDVFVFSWSAVDSPDRVGAVVLLHVDDCLIIGPPRGAEQFRLAVSSFKTGPLECLSKTSALTFLGVNLAAGTFPEVGINQDSPIDRLEAVSLGSLVYQCRIIRPRLSVLKVFRRALRSSIWPTKTKYYASFTVTRLATSSTQLRSTSLGIQETASSINKAARTFKSNRLAIWYRSLSLFPRSASIVEFRQVKLFIISD